MCQNLLIMAHIKEVILDESAQEGYVKREADLLLLSISINKLILEYEQANNTKILCSCDCGRQYPLAYPNEPKIQLFGVFE